MAYEKLAKLLAELIKHTEFGNLKWERTAANGVYQCSFPQYTVQLSETTADNLDATFQLTILDSEGTVIERATHPDFAGAMPTPYTQMKHLYEMARRQALGVDNAIDALLKELSDDIPF
jgi:hypothetical protein